jgi:hypothetical protein
LSRGRPRRKYQRQDTGQDKNREVGRPELFQMAQQCLNAFPRQWIALSLDERELTARGARRISIRASPAH